MTRPQSLPRIKLRNMRRYGMDGCFPSYFPVILNLIDVFEIRFERLKAVGDKVVFGSQCFACENYY